MACVDGTILGNAAADEMHPVPDPPPAERWRARADLSDAHGRTRQRHSGRIAGQAEDLTDRDRTGIRTEGAGDLEAWYEPAYLRFVAKHGLFANAYRTELYFVPLFTGANKAAYEPSLKRFRKSATPETADRVVFVKTELELVRDALGLHDKDIPYFFVVDAQGRIVHREQGAFTEDKLDAIEEALMP
jgi:hypothetical protein